MKTRILSLLLALLLGCAPALASGSVMDAFPDHLLLSDINEGTCQTLTGQVPMVVVFVSIGDDPWTDAELAAKQKELLTAARMLHADAASYGASLNISLQFHYASMPDVPQLQLSAAWVDELISDLPDLHPRSDSAHWRNTPLLFICSVEGRAFAHTINSEHLAEYVILYEDDDSAVIRHELLHLYGATDYYVEESIQAAAEKYFPGSIMLISEYAGTVDDVTAFVIGWTDRPGNAGLQLLGDTASVTAESFTISQSADQITGLGEVTGDDYTYTGMMLDGVSHGWGMIIWENGDSYLGMWQYGVRQGKGTYTWADGVVYTGDFSNGERTGQGTTTWPNGNTYTGSYLRGLRHGKGTYTWPDGEVYIGDFLGGERTGKGVSIKPNGEFYSGDFVGGLFSGSGTRIMSDGSIYTGGFLDGRFHGTGTYVWPNGSSFTGAFSRGMRHGEGIYRSAEGGVLKGTWVNDAYTPDAGE